MNYDEFHEFVYRDMGVKLSSYKETQLNRRIQSLLTRLEIEKLEDYAKLIQNNERERLKFLDYITINVTEFFRNPDLFNELNNLFIKEIDKKKSLKIWSAACSIGCEPYSLSILLNEIDSNKKHSIIATDIDRTILRRAKEGIYSENEIKNVDVFYKNKYFKKAERKYFIDDKLKSKITFKKHDLILDFYEKDFDFIICRNVIIYFKNDVKKEIFKKFSESLKVGGYLFLGATESIYNYKEYGFVKESTFIYKKI